MASLMVGLPLGFMTDSRTATFTIDVTASSGENETLPYFGRYYGGAPVGHGVGETRMRSNPVSNFFWADRTAVIDKFRYHKRANDSSGYSAGGGGTYTVKIVEADAATKLPKSPEVVVSKIDNYQPGPWGGTEQAFLTVDFTTTGQVTAKQPYCFVFENTDAIPDSNYVSTNNDCVYLYLTESDYVNDTAHPPGFWMPARIEIGGQDEPWFPYPVVADGNDLRYRRLGPPLIEYRYSDGQWSGWGAWGTESSYRLTISGASHYRERFRVTRADRVVRSVWVRVWRLNASGGSLVAELESGPASDTSGNGITIETVTVAASQIYDAGSEYQHNEHAAGSAPQDKAHWVEFVFSQNHTLTQGQLYNLRLRAPSGSFVIQATARAEQQGLSPVPSSWNDYEANRTVSWLAWEDSQGMMQSFNSGLSWSYFGKRRMLPILFECVTS